MDIRLFDLKPSEIAGLRLAKDYEAIAYLKKWGMGKSFGKITSDAIVNSLAMGLIVLEKGETPCFMDAGRAIQRMWLASTSYGIAIHPVTTPIMVFASFHSNPERFSEAEQEEISALYTRYLKIFPMAEQKQDVFLFRMVKGKDKKIKSLRKATKDIFLTKSKIEKK